MILMLSLLALIGTGIDITEAQIGWDIRKQLDFTILEGVSTISENLDKIDCPDF